VRINIDDDDDGDDGDEFVHIINFVCFSFFSQSVIEVLITSDANHM